MAEILRTPEECSTVLNLILEELAATVSEIEPRYLEFAVTAHERTLIEVSFDTCLKRPYRPIKYTNLVRKVRSTFTTHLFRELITKHLDVKPLIRPFIEDLAATGLDIEIVLTYSDTSPETIIELIVSRSELEEIPLPNTQYIINYAKSYARSDREFSAFLMFIYFYLSEHLTIPQDLIENIGYYLQELPSLYQHQVLSRLTLPSLLKTINQALESTIPYILSYAILTENRELIDTIYHLLSIDTHHKKLLDELEEHGIITTEDYEENITYLTHISSVLGDLSLFRYVTSFIKYRVSIEEERILEEWTRRIKERILKRPQKFRRTVAILYSIIYDRVTFTKNAIEQLQRVHHKLLRYTTVTVFTKEGIKRLYPFKRLYPYPTAHYVISSIFAKLPAIQPAI